jgi:hypothetical protein
MVRSAQPAMDRLGNKVERYLAQSRASPVAVHDPVRETDSSLPSVGFGNRTDTLP